MITAIAARQILGLLWPEWHVVLQGWAASGELVAAAREAFQLSATPLVLRELVERWAEGDFNSLPPIMLLPASSMPTAAGAYADSTGTIYLNQDWLETASQEEVLSVLTQELGHHLDAQLNSSDTPGDEGALFSVILENPGISPEEFKAYRSADDSGVILLDGQWAEVEMDGLEQMATPRLVKDINPGNQGSLPKHLTPVGRTIFFTAYDGQTGIELWKSDGTSSGTRLVSDVFPGKPFNESPHSSNPVNLKAIGSTLFFSADDGKRGFELWKTDGTSAGTNLVADINKNRISTSGGISDDNRIRLTSSSPNRLTAFGDSLFFAARDGNQFPFDFSLWKTDGTEFGTVRIEIADGLAGNSPSNLIESGGTLFFSYWGNASFGAELWKVDAAINQAVLRNLWTTSAQGGYLASICP